jgi:hypothetical protein
MIIVVISWRTQMETAISGEDDCSFINLQFIWAIIWFLQPFSFLEEVH